MRLDLRSNCVNIVLSRRNVLSLLHKLEMPGSASTLTGADNYVNGEPVDHLLLVLQVEEDAPHYGSRPAPPGPMHPLTETFVSQHRQHSENPDPGWQPLASPRLQFDRQRELHELLTLDPVFVHLERTGPCSFWLVLDRLHVLFTTDPAASGETTEAPTLRCRAWSDTVDHIDYSYAVLEGEAARLLIHGDRPETPEKAEQE
jgi:hypothetical protein